MAERKEWVRASHSPAGTTATVTLQEGNVSVKWTVKTYVGEIRKGVAESRGGAERALAELHEALSEIGEAKA